MRCGLGQHSSLGCSPSCSGLTLPSSGRPKGRFAPFGPPLMSNVRPHAMHLRMPPKHRNATLGLLVAASLSLYLVFRLVQASSPAPTSVHLTNLGSRAVTVTNLQVRGESALNQNLSLPPASADTSAPAAVSNTVNIAAGLPLEVQARLGESPSPLTCTLTPRPQGVCIIRANITAALELQCTYECQVESSR